MDKVIIGTILKKRIKEQGYTQEGFAEKVGIGLSSLKKYMSGEVAYSYEVMEMFAEELDCSFDYLMGRSKSPCPEFHEIKEQTRLSEEAIRKICRYAEKYDTAPDDRTYIRTLDMLICEDGVINSIRGYLTSYKKVDEVTSLLVAWFWAELRKNSILAEKLEEEGKRPVAETQQMIDVIISLKNMKTKLTPEILEEFKQELEIEHTIEELKERVKQAEAEAMKCV